MLSVAVEGVEKASKPLREVEAAAGAVCQLFQPGQSRLRQRERAISPFWTGGNWLPSSELAVLWDL
jgi:hypothetical protein